MKPIYLDNAATTETAPEVVDAMNRVITDGLRNPSSLYGPGVAAARAVRSAMDTIAGVVGGGPWNVVFTSGGSEADTLAVLGTMPKGKLVGVVTSSLEHAAIDESCNKIEVLGGIQIRISGGESGVVTPSDVAAATDDSTGLVTITHVASELGTVQPVTGIAEAVKSKNKRCIFHTDAVQAFAQLPRLDYSPDVDMVSLSAHKIHGPMGIGALLLRPNVRPRPIICGGDQQGGLRPGTLNVPGIVGFEAAVRLLEKNRKAAADTMKHLTDALIEGIAGQVEGVRPLGDPTRRAPGMVVLAVRDVRSEVLLHAAEARGVLASAGSACHATRTEPAQCIKEAGLTRNEGVLRLSLSNDTTSSQIDPAIRAIVNAVESIRAGRASG